MPRFESRNDGRDGIDVVRLTPTTVVVAWQFRPTVEDLSTVELKFFRSYEVQEADDEVFLGTASGDLPFFKDESAQLLNRVRRPYYRVEVTGGSTPPFESRGHTVGAEPTPEGAAILRRIAILLRRAGVPVLVYKRRTAGVRCPDCWDPVSSSKYKSGCATCLDTGWDRGYHAPIATHMDIRPADKVNAPQETEMQPRRATALTAAYPVIEPGDLVVEVETLERWRVGEPVRPAELHRVLLHQDLLLVGVNTSDVEQKKLAIPAVIGRYVIGGLPERPVTYVSAEGSDNVDVQVQRFAPPVG